MKKVPWGLRNSPNKADTDLFLDLIVYSFIIPVFPKVPKNMKNIFTPNSCTSLVLWNSSSLGSTLPPSRPEGYQNLQHSYAASQVSLVII